MPSRAEVEAAAKVISRYDCEGVSEHEPNRHAAEALYVARAALTAAERVRKPKGGIVDPPIEITLAPGERILHPREARTQGESVTVRPCRVGAPTEGDRGMSDRDIDAELEEARLRAADELADAVYRLGEEYGLTEYVAAAFTAYREAANEPKLHEPAAHISTQEADQ